MARPAGRLPPTDRPLNYNPILHRFATFYDTVLILKKVKRPPPVVTRSGTTGPLRWFSARPGQTEPPTVDHVFGRKTPLPATPRPAGSGDRQAPGVWGGKPPYRPAAVTPRRLKDARENSAPRRRLSRPIDQQRLNSRSICFDGNRPEADLHTSAPKAVIHVPLQPLHFGRAPHVLPSQANRKCQVL